MTRRYKLCVITATRAEYGLLSSVIKQIQDDPECELQLIATGTHLEPEFGLTYKEIEDDGVPITRKIPIYQGGEDAQVLTTMAAASSGIGQAIVELAPDMVVLLGDRYELLPIAGACVVLRIPIAHISGGEVSEGAYDEYIRHAVSKLSYLHFTSTEAYRDRVIQLGESPRRVFNVGDLGIANIKRLKRWTKAQLEQDLGIAIGDRLLQVTFHPTTLENDSERQFGELLAALNERPGYQIVFTRPNADSGSASINRMIDAFIADNAHRSCAFASLGYVRFLSLVSYCVAMVGNSSSGVVEVPSLQVGSINIGNRQRGRICADTVIHCSPDKDEIVAALDRVGSEAYKELVRSAANPYDSDGTAVQIVQRMKACLADYQGMHKTFYRGARDDSY
ncbi:UDP-N-acetylglucosamine 2-epimerase (hydrolyzing) [Paenibacillus lycopersici]|uniref:UDP-N-acetylglucosamine 2-epimerase (Hydrolyzing) n=1 Tax=Paenibacillus lycopersici TaxID=2704462 RepID=A0A6C0G540_9BACL|nr:UDP-N-acetylglucosamine 2-epimerase [Paenibacillus lycopersici]QHT63433.1 UDP-N-acetylglucosamine 2-epimerase (hydrolyzing) [Paenibacillus lycopersici]